MLLLTHSHLLFSHRHTLVYAYSVCNSLLLLWPSQKVSLTVEKELSCAIRASKSTSRSFFSSSPLEHTYTRIRTQKYTQNPKSSCILLSSRSPFRANRMTTADERLRNTDLGSTGLNSCTLHFVFLLDLHLVYHTVLAFRFRFIIFVFCLTACAP